MAWSRFHTFLNFHGRDLIRIRLASILTNPIIHFFLSFGLHMGALGDKQGVSVPRIALAYLPSHQDGIHGQHRA